MQQYPVVELNRAVALAMPNSPERALEAMDRPEVSGPLQKNRWYHSARTELLRRIGRLVESASAYRRALELINNASEAKFLEGRLAKVRPETRDDRDT